MQDCLRFPYFDRDDVELNETLLATDVLSLLLYQNVRTTGVSTAEPEGNSLGPGWFRFQGSAGTRMATSCPAHQRCVTNNSGWLNGGHPSVADGQVTSTVYFRGYSHCFYYSTNIKVRNCGSYYVYYLSGTPACNLRYCGTN